MCFKGGMKIRMCLCFFVFFRILELFIYVFNFLRILELFLPLFLHVYSYFYKALIPQKCKGSMHLVLATHSAVLGQFFSKLDRCFLGCRYACAYFRILKFFLLLFYIFNLDYFES